MMKILAVTGGIGSGKSVVCRILANRWGLPVYEADSRVKSLYVNHPSLLGSIEVVLDCPLRDGNGRFVPAMLAEKIFCGSGALEKVEALVFPVLKEDFRRFADESGEKGIVVFESATILEKPQFKGFADKVLFVDAPFDLRLERACMRDGACPETVLARMDKQKLMNDLCGCPCNAGIDACIVNDGTEKELEHKVDDVMKTMFADEIRNRVILITEHKNS